MQQHILIKDLQPHSKMRGIYLISAASLQHAKNGPYWNITLNDSSGEINAKIWAPLSMEFNNLCAGNFVDVAGNTSLFREQIQLNINALRQLSDAESVELDTSLYVPTSPYNIEDMWQELEELCQKELTHTPWNDFVFYVLNRNEIRLALMACPAAKNIHHAYRGGLLEHSLSVAKLAMTIAKQYPELDRQVLLVAAIFHDLGKIWEYSYGLVTDYTDAGRLLGHMHLALEFLAPILEQCNVESDYIQHFKHLILSHHGTYEFGSPRLPQTPEAMILHYADNIDAKMAQCRQLFVDNEQDFVGWSPYQRSLDRCIYQPSRLSPVTKNEEEIGQTEHLVLGNTECASSDTNTEGNTQISAEFLTEQTPMEIEEVPPSQNIIQDSEHENLPQNQIVDEQNIVTSQENINNPDSSDTENNKTQAESQVAAAQLGFFFNFK